MADPSVVCPELFSLHCAQQFQTLIAGVLAIVAAVATAIVIWSAAKLPISEQRRRLQELEGRRWEFAKSRIASDLRLLQVRAGMAASTIRTFAAAPGARVTDETRRKTNLQFPNLADEWEFMSLFPSDTIEKVTALRRLVEDHNFDVLRAGGPFGADNFREMMLRRLGTIQADSDTVHHLFAPNDED